MNLSPIITRELKLESRRGFNYRLRVSGATLLTLIFAVFLWHQPGVPSGGDAFSILSFFVFCAIWFVVPTLAADCISREKREGTLGLLFLTSLKPIELILAKGGIHALRSLSLGVASIPILAVSFILGGVTGSDVLSAIILCLAAFIFSLAAGLLGSLCAREWVRAVMLAGFFSASFAFLFSRLALWILFGSARGGASWLEDFLFEKQLLFYNAQLQANQNISAPAVPGIHEILGLGGWMLLTALLILALAIMIAAVQLPRTWRENPSALGARWRKIFCSPQRETKYFSWRPRSRPSRNPVGWLQQYSWTARLSKWGWCLLALAAGVWLLTKNFSALQQGLSWLTTAVLLSMTFSAVASFQREKQNGALELLLVSPLKEEQIILGRLYGIWGQFIPAFVVLLLIAFFIRSHKNYGSDPGAVNIFSATCDFVLIPIVGLYFAMRMKYFLGAWIVTAGLTLFLPSFLIGLAHTGWIAVVATLTAILLYFDLKNRSFALENWSA